MTNPVRAFAVRIHGQITLIFRLGVSELSVSLSRQGQVFLRVSLMLVRWLLQHLGVYLDSTGDLAGDHCAAGVLHQLHDFRVGLDSYARIAFL